MASPFRVFRKHQKIILVAAGVLCMFVFVIGDVAFSLLGTRGNVREGGEHTYEDVAVEWNGGELTLGEVRGLVARRNILRGFLEDAVRMGMAAPGASPTGPSVQLVMSLNENMETAEQQAVYRHLLAEAARDAGMVVSDDAINQYLSQLTQGQVSAEQLRALASRRSYNNRRVSMTYLFDALREEMLANAYLNSYSATLASITPQQRWDDWRKLNDRVVIESLAVPVGNFVDQVPDPSPEELRTFYEQYKNVEPMNVLVPPYTELPSPEPGFRIPRRVEVHYVEATYDSLLEKLAADVTEEEIQEYYEAHKEDYTRLQYDDAPLGQPPASAGQEGAGEGPAASDEDAAESAEPSGEVTEETDAPDASAAGQGAQADPAASAQPGDAEAAPPSEPEDAPQSSHLLVPADEPTQYVVFQDTPTSDAAADAATAAAESAEAPDAAGPSTSPPPAESGNANPEGLPPEPEEPVEVEYLPLDVVRDEIRNTIAGERVSERLREALPKIRDELARGYRAYAERRLDAEALNKDPEAVPPPEFDLQRLAGTYGLEAKQTPLLSQLELKETPLGESLVQQVGLPYWYYALNQQELYQPVWTGLTVGALEQLRGLFNEYIAVKVEDEPARTPPLDEVRDEVVRTYKRVQARDLAMTAAEELAEKAAAAEGPLEQQFAESKELEVTQSDPFTWYADSMGDYFHLGKPFGVEHAGPEFMETVYGLSPGEVTTVWNHDKSVAYVVRLDRHEMNEDALRNLFLREATQSQALAKAANFRRSQLSQALVESVFEQAGVQWKIPPDQPSKAT